MLPTEDFSSRDSLLAGKRHTLQVLFCRSNLYRLQGQRTREWKIPKINRALAQLSPKHFQCGNLDRPAAKLTFAHPEHAAGLQPLVQNLQGSLRQGQFVDNVTDLLLLIHALLPCQLAVTYLLCLWGEEENGEDMAGRTGVGIQVTSVNLALCTRFHLRHARMSWDMGDGQVLSKGAMQINIS